MAARDRRDFVEAIAIADRLLQTDEWREDAVRESMAARYESRDRPGALAAYERFAERLSVELGADPMAETTALRDAIAAGVPLTQDANGSSFSPAHPYSARRSSVAATNSRV